MHRSLNTFSMQTFVIMVYLVLIVLSPSVHFINYIEFHDCQRVIQLLLLGLILFDASLLWLSKTNIIINRKIQVGFLTLFVLTTTSAVLSSEPRYAIIEISIFLALCYLSLLVARLFTNNSELFIKQLTYTLWLSIILYMISFYTGYISAMVVGKMLIWPHPFYGFSNIRLFQQYQLWAIGFICLPLLNLDLKKVIRFWLYIALMCWWVLLFYAASRGVVLGWLVAMLTTAIVYKKQAWPFLRIQLINAITGLGAYQLFFKALPYWIVSASVTKTNATETIITSTIFRSTTYDRLDLWKAAYVMIKNFPFFGVGPMQFYFYTPHGTHPHNSVLQLASEFGLPATIIILLIAGYCFNCWIKKFNAKQIKSDTNQNKNLSIILFFTITASAAYSMVEGVIIMPISQVLMFTMIGLMIGQYTNKTSPIADVPKQTKNKSWGRPIFAMITLVLMALSTAPELVRGLTSKSRGLAHNERAFSMKPDTINPRIWMQQRRVENKKTKQ